MQDIELVYFLVLRPIHTVTITAPYILPLAQFERYVREEERVLQAVSGKPRGKEEGKPNGMEGNRHVLRSFKLRRTTTSWIPSIS